MHNMAAGRDGVRCWLRVILGGLSVIVAVALLASCAVQHPNPEGTTRPTSDPTGEPTVAPENPELKPNGSALANQPYFDQLIRTLLASTPGPDGRTVIDALVAGGFDKSAMEVTSDRTPTGLATDALEFSVRWSKTSCLIGQIKGAEYYSAVASPVSDTCLVGQTRPIDW